jgi:hypothetical protein
LGKSETIYTLKIPIEYKNKEGVTVTVKEFNVSRVKVKHFKSLPKNLLSKKSINLEDYKPLIRALTGLTEETVDEMDFIDLAGVAKVINNSLGELKTLGTL